MDFYKWFSGLLLMPIDEILGWTATILLVPVMVIYFIQTVRGHSTPNPATWIIWLSVGILNAITYVLIVEQWAKKTIAIVMVTAVAIIFIYSLLNGKFSPLRKKEKWALRLTVILATFWIITQNSNVANLLIQGIYIISFWTMIDSLIKGDAKEKHLPWTMSVFAYGILLISLLINFSGNYYELFYPIVNGIIGNGIVAFIAYSKSK